jgi:hypothetical protein
LNSRPAVYKTAALPLCYCGRGAQFYPLSPIKQLPPPPKSPQPPKTPPAPRFPTQNPIPETRKARRPLHLPSAPPPNLLNLFNPGRGTRDAGHATRDTGHGTRDTRHGTRDTRHGTRDSGPGTQDTNHAPYFFCSIFYSLLSTFYRVPTRSPLPQNQDGSFAHR